MLITALLASLSSVGRFAFAAIPSVQPASFIIIMTGVLLGPGAGLVCGVITGFLSNLLLGMLWPYAAWHMLLWGVMGLLAGLLGRLPFWLHATLGFAWGFVFGWVMNLMWYTMGAPFSLPVFILACVSSAAFDLAHALANLLLIGALALPTKIIFQRMGLIYDHTGKRSRHLP
jgi:energy-coupling factor transport system substrate-specific component